MLRHPGKWSSKFLLSVQESFLINKVEIKTEKLSIQKWFINWDKYKSSSRLRIAWDQSHWKSGTRKHFQIPYQLCFAVHQPLRALRGTFFASFSFGKFASLSVFPQPLIFIVFPQMSLPLVKCRFINHKSERVAVGMQKLLMCWINSFAGGRLEKVAEHFIRPSTFRNLHTN